MHSTIVSKEKPTKNQVSRLLGNPQRPQKNPCCFIRKRVSLVVSTKSSPIKDLKIKKTFFLYSKLVCTKIVKLALQKRLREKLNVRKKVTTKSR